MYIAVERKVLFNSVLNTIYVRLYGVRHMVKDHSLMGENLLPLLPGLFLPARDLSQVPYFR